MSSTSPPESARVGRTLAGTWHVERVLGAGGMATVYAARHVRNGLPVALKVLRKTIAMDAAHRQRFVKEGYIANQVDHPGVVKVLDDGIDGDDVFAVMDRLDGHTLHDEWTAAFGAIPFERVCTVVDWLLDVLSVAHAAGVVHRDVKPGNIFVCTDGSLRLMDFGVARIRDGPEGPRTSTGDLIGTPAFMAPEQAAGRHASVDARSDVFSVGATAWVLLTGSLTHQASTVGELLVTVATRPVPSIATAAANVPPAFAQVLDRALAFDPGARWQSAAAMRRAWQLAEAAQDSRGSSSVVAAGGTERMQVGAPSAPPSGGSLDTVALRTLASRPPAHPSPGDALSAGSARSDAVPATQRDPMPAAASSFQPWHLWILASVGTTVLAVAVVLWLLI